jgi:hypothetical protein
VEIRRMPDRLRCYRSWHQAKFDFDPANDHIVKEGSSKAKPIRRKDP